MDLHEQEEFEEAFLSLAGEDGEIDAYELQDILNRVFVKGNLRLVLNTNFLSHCCTNDTLKMTGN